MWVHGSVNAIKFMNDINKVKYYPPLEEKINVISHAIGLILSIFALVLLVWQASRHGDIWYTVSFGVFGVSLIVLYAASTFYHNSKLVERRSRLRIFDHASIFVLIAGTYTPFTLVTLKGPTGWLIFGIVWGLALTGIVLKLFFTGKFNLISVLTYICMSWVIVFVIKPLISNLSSDGLFWLFSGGVAYTLGAIVYSIKKIPFNHAIFHVFVLFGSACHFVAVFLYVLPVG